MSSASAASDNGGASVLLEEGEVLDATLHLIQEDYPRPHVPLKGVCACVCVCMCVYVCAGVRVCACKCVEVWLCVFV